MSLQKVVEQFESDYLAIADKVLRAVRSYVRQGMTVDNAISRAFRDIGISKTETILKEAVLGAIEGVSAGVAIDAKTIAAGWEAKYTLDGKNLSQRLYQSINNMSETVRMEVKRSLSKVQGWQSAAKELVQSTSITGDVNKQLLKLSSVTRADVGSANYTQIQKALRTAKRYVSGLSEGGAPTKPLKAAYSRLLSAVERGEKVAIDKALNNAVKQKSLYNAQRLVRTETAKAYGDTFFDTILQDEDAIGYRSVLSPRHPVPDICNFYAEADLFGMGKGVFPLTDAPPYPYHPNCLCILQPVYQGETKTVQKDADKKYIRNLSEDKAKALFGSNYDKVKDDPGTWKEYLVGFSEFVNTKYL